MHRIPAQVVARATHTRGVIGTAQQALEEVGYAQQPLTHWDMTIVSHPVLINVVVLERKRTMHCVPQTLAPRARRRILHLVAHSWAAAPVPARR